MKSPEKAPDRYDRQRILGEGGAGRVWLVEDRDRPGRPVALKELSPESSQHEGRKADLIKEFALLFSLRHPGLAEAQEMSLDPLTRLPRFSQEWIEGRRFLDAAAEAEAEELLEWSAQALRTLAFVHLFGLAHGDIKPDNLLIRDRAKLGYRVALVDFGLATELERIEGRELQLKGTLPYLAPERFENRPPSIAADLYAFGALTFEAIHGHPPFVLDPQQPARFIESVRQGRRSRPQLPPRLPAGLSAWLEKMISPRPEDRPRDAIDALDQLNRLCDLSFDLDLPADRAARLLSGPPAGLDSTLKRIDESEPQRLLLICADSGAGKSRLLRWLVTDAMRRGETVETELNETTEAGAACLIDDGERLNERQLSLLERRMQTSPRGRTIIALNPRRARRGSIQRLLKRAAHARDIERIELPDLDRLSIRRICERAFNGGLSEHRIRKIERESGGKPRQIERLLIAGDGATTAERSELLSPSTLRWLQALALFGETANDDQLRSWLQATPTENEHAIQEALSAGLIWRRHRGWSQPRALADRLYRELRESGTEPFQRAYQILEEGDTTLPEVQSQLARLAAAGGDLDAAEGHATEAATGFMKRRDPAAAATEWSHALLHRRRDRQRARRHELQMKRGEAALRAGDNRQAIRAFSAARRWAIDTPTRLRATIRRALARVRAGQFEIALQESGAVAQRALAAGAPDDLALARRISGIALARLGRENEALPIIDDALSMLDRLEDERGVAQLLHLRANCRLRLGREDAEADFVAALERFDESDPDALRSQFGLAELMIRQRRLDDAERMLSAAEQQAEGAGWIDLQQVALSKRAVIAIEAGAFDRAIRLAGEAADLAHQLGDLNRLWVERCHQAEAQIRVGDPELGARSLRQLLNGETAQAQTSSAIEPATEEAAELTLAWAELRSDEDTDRSVRDRIDRVRRRARRRGANRLARWALAIELERRADPRCADAFDAAWAEFRAESTAAGGDGEIDRLAMLARARWQLLRARAQEALDQLDLLPTELEPGREDSLEVDRWAMRAEAYERLGKGDDVDAALERAREIRGRCAERIADPEQRERFCKQRRWSLLERPEARSGGDHQTRLLALYDMLAILNSANDPDQLLESILDLALRALGAERGMVLLKPEEESRDSEPFAVHMARNLDPDTIDDVRSYSRQIVQAAARGESLLALDASSDERFRDFRSVSLYGIRSLICVPLRVRGEIIGTVYLDRQREGKLFTQDDLRFLEAFADQAALALGGLLERRALQRQNRELKKLAAQRTQFDQIVGRCDAMQRLFDTIDKFAATDLPVLIHGESGTGKELVAKALHLHGPRRRRTFVSENCAALPETLLESELFGHVRGAFTGADRDHPGLFEQAHRGTLFLDEIGDMSAAMQARLLRVLQEGTLRRVGGERSIEVDVRVLAATHRDLDAEVAAGRFREDLLYRLRVLHLPLPALRDRDGDLPLLCEHLLERIAEQRDLPKPRLDVDLLPHLQRYDWPGNIRQLDNMLQRLTVLAGSEPISIATLRQAPDLLRQLGVEGEAPESPARFSFESGEREQLAGALAACNGNRSAAARLLNVSRATLYRKLRRHAL